MKLMMILCFTNKFYNKNYPIRTNEVLYDIELYKDGYVQKLSYQISGPFSRKLKVSLNV